MGGQQQNKQVPDRDKPLDLLLARGLKDSDLTVPIKDLPDGKRRKIAPAFAQAFLDHREVLAERLENGRNFVVYTDEELQDVSSARPPADSLLRILEKKADIRADPTPKTRELLPLELYYNLSSQDYIAPRMGKAIKHLLKHDIITNPFDVSGARFVRIRKDLDQPVAEDDGCYLIFHPVKENGDTQVGLGAGERTHKARLPIVFKFGKEGELEKMILHDQLKDRKLDGSIVDAYVDITQPVEDYFTKTSIEKIDGVEDPATLIQKATTTARSGKKVGTIYTQNGDGRSHHITVYEIKDKDARERLGVKGERVGVVKDDYENITGLVGIREDAAPSDEIDGVRVAYHVEDKDMGMRPTKTLDREIHELAVQEHLWRTGEPRMDFSERITATKTVLREIADASVQEIAQDPDEKRRTMRRLITTLSPAVPHLIRLKKELPEKIGSMDGADRKRLAPLLSASHAQLFQAAASMVAKTDAINILWPLESTDQFIQGYNDHLDTQQRDYAMSVGSVVKQQMRTIHFENQDNWRKVMKGLEKEGARTRRHISFEASEIRNEIGQTNSVLFNHIGRIDGNEELVGQIAEALPEMRDVLKSIGADTTNITKAIEERGDEKTKLVLEAGITTFLGGIKLQRDIKLGKVDESVLGGSGDLTEKIRQTDVKDTIMGKLGDGLGKLSLPFRKIASRIKSLKDLSFADVSQLNELLSYDAMRNQ
ncbi:hypothetical protein ACFLRF_01585 [Candidatus Altiarchaeota archaeon]